MVLLFCVFFFVCLFAIVLMCIKCVFYVWYRVVSPEASFSVSICWWWWLLFLLINVFVLCVCITDDCKAWWLHFSVANTYFTSFHWCSFFSLLILMLLLLILIGLRDDVDNLEMFKRFIILWLNNWFLILMYPMLNWK